MSKIRILIADSFLFPGGGQEKVVLQLLRLLDRDKFEVFFATGDKAEIPTDLPPDIKIFRVGFTSKFDISSCFKIRKIVKKEKIQIINVHGFRSSLLIRLAFLLSRKKVKIVYTAQVNYEQLKLYSKSLHNRLSIVIGNFLDSTATDAIVFVSKKNMLTRLEEKPKISKEKCRVIYNGVNAFDLNVINSTRSGSSKIIVSLSALVPRKGLHILIEAAHILIEQGVHDFKIKIGGQGPEQQNLEDLIRKYNLEERVMMVGYVKKESLLSEADLFILPTFSEGLPLSIIEAGIFGLPVIASAVDGIPEIIENNSNGLLTQPGSAQELASAIKLVLQDEHTANKMGQRLNKTAISNFSEQGMIEQYSSLFESEAVKEA